MLQHLGRGESTTWLLGRELPAYEGFGCSACGSSEQRGPARHSFTSVLIRRDWPRDWSHPKMTQQGEPWMGAQQLL